MQTCKFCNKNPSVKKSHIIPEFMYKHTYDDKHKMVITDKALDEQGERQKGYYEPLLCVGCEQYFNENFEKPCLNFVKEIPDQAELGSTFRFSSTPVLELLLLSVIWRASHAVADPWQGVDLGQHESIVKECLEKKVSNSNYKFWVYLSATPDGKIQKGVISSVEKLRVKGHLFYHFIASGVQYLMKISSHQILHITPEPIQFNRDISAKVYDMRKMPSMRAIFEN